MSVGPVGAAHARPIAAGAATSTGNTAVVDLMPPACEMGGMQGVTAMLCWLQSKLASAQEQLGKTQVDVTSAKRDDAIRASERARREAEEAAEKGGFLDFVVEKSGLVDTIAMIPGVGRSAAKDIAKDITKGALVAGSLVATVMSAGSTAALCVAAVGVALSYGGQAVASSGVLGQDASRWVGVGMQIAGAALMVTGGFMGDTSALTRAGAFINGGIAVINGSEQIVTSIHQYEADTKNIEAEHLKVTIKQLEKMIDDVIDQMKEDHDTSNKTKEAAQGAVQALDQAQLITVQAVRA